MKPTHLDSITRLNSEIIAIQGLITYLIDITDTNDHNQLKESLDRIAMLKNELASLKVERQALVDNSL